MKTKEIIKPRIKKGDTVKVIAGKNRGEMGKVQAVLKEKGLVVIEGMNLAKKHEKPKQGGKKGQVVSIAMPMHISNVAMICHACKKITRIGFKEKGEEKGVKKRICKKCQAEI